jgi:hypothetical protein
MNNITKSQGLLVCLIILLALPSCGRSKLYGEAITDRTITKTGDILSNVTMHEDKTVTTKGTIVRQCPTGCWFDLQDETGTIYVDLGPSGFAIPQKTGKAVIVQGTVSIRGGKPMIIGTGVEIP